MSRTAWGLMLVAAVIAVWMTMRVDAVDSAKRSTMRGARPSESAPPATVCGVASAPASPSPNSTASRRAPAASDSPDDITGRVIDRDGRPVVPLEVRVVLQVPQDQPNYVAVAAFDRRVAVDLEGRFRLAVPRHGKYQVLAEPDGLAVTLRNWVNPGDHVELIAGPAASLRGRVKRGEDGQPVEGARISVYVDGVVDRPVRETSTTAQGEYDVGGLPASAVLLSTRANGLVAKWEDLELKVGPNDHDVTMDRGRLVTGRVTDRANRPIAGVRIEGFVFGGSSHTTATDFEGRFSLAGFGTGPLGFWARKEGFVPGWLTPEPESESDPVSIGFTLTESESVTGSVHDPAGRPISGARVVTKEAEAVTDAAGRFTVSANPDSDSVLSVTSVGCTPRTVRRNDPDFIESKSIVLEPADVTIGGHVRDADGRLLAGVRVECRAIVHGAASFERVAGTEPDGSFVVAGAPRGLAFELVALAPGFWEAVASVAPQEGAARPAVELIIEAAPAIEGLVVDTDGRPIEGARLALSVVGPAHAVGVATPTVTDREGRFMMRSPFRRDAALMLRASARGYWRSWVTLERDQLGPIGPIVLDRSGRIRGRLVDAETNAPIRNVQVSLRSGGGPYEARMAPDEESLGRTGETGDFDIEALACPWWLTPEAPGYAVEPKAVDLHAGESIDLGTIPLRVGAALQGAVVTNSGAGGSFAIHLRDPSRPAICVAHTDAAGHFRAAGILPGTYDAFAVAVAGAWYQSSASKFSPAWPLGSVQLIAGEMSLLEARLPASATLTLNITGDLPPGATPSGWQVTCPLGDQDRQITMTALDGHPMGACDGVLTSTASISSAQLTAGTVILGLPPGRYRLSFAHPGFDAAEMFVTLEPGKGTTVELAVSRSGAAPRPR